MGIFGAEQGVACIRDLMEIYHRKKFKTVTGAYNATANVKYAADYFIKHGLKMNNERQICVSCVAAVNVFSIACSEMRT